MDVKKLYLKLTPLNTERLIHSFKTGLACLIGIIAAEIFHLPSAQWLLITIMVVMCAQLSIGSILQRSYMRFAGTVMGSILAIITLYFFGSDPTISTIVIIIFTILFSYLATGETHFSEAGTLGAATLAIILINPVPTILTGVGRFFEISLGILIAAIVSQFILPSHARNHLRKTQAQTLRELHRYFEDLIINKITLNQTEEYIELDEEIVKSLLTQRKLALAAKREPIGEQFNTDFFKKTLWCEKEILRCISFMYFSSHASEKANQTINNIPLLEEVHASMAQALKTLADCIENRTTDNILLPSLIPLQSSFEKARTHLSFEEQVYLDAYLFSVEVMIHRMQKLIQLLTTLK